MRVIPVILSVCLVGCASLPQARNAPSADPSADAATHHRPHRPPPRPAPPAPQLVGAGMDVRLNVVGSDPVVAFTSSDGTHVIDVTQGTTAVYAGTLEDLQDGSVLTEATSDVVPNQLFVDGTLVAREIGNPMPVVIAGHDVAWIQGGIEVSPITPLTSASPFLSGTYVSPPTTGDFVGLDASGASIAWVVETGPTDCAIYVNSVLVSPGCAFDLKVTDANGIVYVGWADGASVTVAASKDSGVTWTLTPVYAGGQGVYGQDYAVRADGSLIVAWTQFLTAEDGSSVWESDSGGLPVRLSQPVVAGFSGASNPQVAPDGSVAWLDDSHSSAIGIYNVFLNGADLSTVDEVTQGPVLRLTPDGTRVVAWDDGTSVWIEQLPN